METEDDRRYVVVRNEEEQFSVWPAARAVPAGWAVAGPAGTRAQCLDHIRGVWTDLRPKSLRDLRDA